MKINEFVSTYKNHPVLFVGTGLSLRYLKNSYSWDNLLEKISKDLKGNSEFYLNIKSKCQIDGQYRYDKIASLLENEFNKILENDRDGRFKKINDIFFENMKKEINISRFKIYLSELLKNLDYNKEKENEIKQLKKMRKNIGSVITTNYDLLIEDIFEFNPLIGNNILLSNPYGAVYKIHGCVSQAEEIIITEDDYNKFDNQYELIRAQLLSLFIHNPIIFIGYSIGDQNIKKILKTIFTYVKPNTELAKKIRSNFLLVEFEKDSKNEDVSEHDIDMEDFSTIRINKLKTDNYSSLYKPLANIHLPITALDIRKVEKIVKQIREGGEIQVKITEDLDDLENGDKVLVIGSHKTIKYEFQTASEMMINYFKIIEEENFQLLQLIEKLKIQSSQYFPIFGFSKINNEIESIDKLKKQQKDKIDSIIRGTKIKHKNNYKSIKKILDDEKITSSYKQTAIVWGIMKENLKLNEVKEYLQKYPQKRTTGYRQILCAYDLKKFGAKED